MLIKPWLRLVRIQNLLIIAFILLVFKYAFLSQLGFAFALNHLYYFLFTLSVILVAAGGNIINDINDKRADKINRPGKNPVGQEISEKTARFTYWFLSIVGLALGYFVAYVVGLPSLGGIHLVAFFLLWMYSTDFKHRVFFGNIIVAILAAITILMIPIFDFIPANKGSIETYGNLFILYASYASFAFLTTLIREIIKDQQDVIGDKRVGSRTLATQFTIGFVKNLIFVLILILLYGLGMVLWILKGQTFFMVYISVFMILPSIYLVYLIFKAKSKEQWASCSKLVKGIMLVGISSVAVFTMMS